MTIVLATRVARLAERLLEIFSEIGAAEPVPYKGVMEGALSIWEVLRTLKDPGDLSDPRVVQRCIASAGIHDLSAKISAVWDRFPQMRNDLVPHLRLLARSYHVGQNSVNERWEVIDGEARNVGSSDKVIELYLACLCALIDASVLLDDPVHSSGGGNPDVLATMPDGTVWAFALKTLSKANRAENVPKNLADLIADGWNQISRCSCHKGVVVVNAKNVLDHDSLRRRSYGDANEAAAAVAAQLDMMRQQLWDYEAGRLPENLLRDPKVAPIAIFIAHATVFCRPEGRDMLSPTEIKVMKVMTLPDKFDPLTNPTTSEVWKMAECLNCRVAFVV